MNNTSDSNVRELKTDSTLWATPAKIFNLLDFKPEKLNTDKIIKIPSITIVIKSLIEKDNKFYLELSLNRC